MLSYISTVLNPFRREKKWYVFNILFLVESHFFFILLLTDWLIFTLLLSSMWHLPQNCNAVICISCGDYVWVIEYIYFFCCFSTISVIVLIRFMCLFKIFNQRVEIMVLNYSWCKMPFNLKWENSVVKCQRHVRLNSRTLKFHIIKRILKLHIESMKEMKVRERESV